jgi:DNA-binding HxlR family transcriptional regulator
MQARGATVVRVPYRPFTGQNCSVAAALAVVGERWTLLVMREVLLGRRRFAEIQRKTGIASNILADRLKRLLQLGLLTKADDPSHKQKAIYSLTEMAITLVPIMAHLGAWGRVWLPVSEELSIRAELLEKGGPQLWEQFMDELRHEHVGAPAKTPPGARGVRAQLQAGYDAVVARKAEAVPG